MDAAYTGLLDSIRTAFAKANGVKPALFSANGHDGGQVVFEGLPADLVAVRSTLTGEHLADYVG